MILSLVFLTLAGILLFGRPPETPDLLENIQDISPNTVWLATRKSK